MVQEVSQHENINVTDPNDGAIGSEQNPNISSSLGESATENNSGKEHQSNVVDETTLQSVLSSMTEPEVHTFLEELHKTGKVYLPGIGQTIELLTISAPVEMPTTQLAMTTLPTPQISQNQQTAEILLQELTSLIQQPPEDMIPIDIEQNLTERPLDIKSSFNMGGFGFRQARTANTYGGTSVIGSSRPGTAVKSTISSLGSATIRKSTKQQIFHDDRIFFGRSSPSIPTTIGQGQYHTRAGLVSNKQYPSVGSSVGQQRRAVTSNTAEYQSSNLRRPLSWFQNRSRHYSSVDDLDSDHDLSPPSYSLSGSDNLGPTRRSTRVPKPKQDADFVTFPLLDRDEHGNPIPPAPSSVPSHKTEDDEDDIPYRLMDYPRPIQNSQGSATISTAASHCTSVGLERKLRTDAEIRATVSTNKKQPRWPDDELFHVKSFVPLIIPQQITNPSTMKNKMTMCKPLVHEREVEAKPTRFTIATQTEMEHMIPDVPFVTLPAPIFLPSPSPSYKLFKPRAVPIPVPFFVPIMVPVTKTAYDNIRSYLQAQRDHLPDDPFEAALVIHAESLVRIENNPPQVATHHTDSTTMIMMTDFDRDVDACLTSSKPVENLPELDLEAHYIHRIGLDEPEIQKMLPDAESRLKWSYGVEAFQRWCVQHNRSMMNSLELNTHEEEMIPKPYLVKSNLLSYANGDELQHVMSIFLDNVRRPTGDPYLPESIYYLCLGIQFYLNTNNRSIDLFDPKYVEFNSTLNRVLLNYSPRILAGSNTYVSLIHEDLLYDVHQLGMLTPWSLLRTLIYTNAKYFNLKTAESHMTVSFANFGKYSQWERPTTNAGQGRQMNYLRFYAHNPDLKLLAKSPIVYEVTEQINDPVRCSIKQYDFYVSKCPEEVRGAADIFYLHPISGKKFEDSLWFTNKPLSSTIIDQFLSHLKLLPDFYNQTKPVETNTFSTGRNSPI